MENFQQPYFSTNITEFWRRWHISLSTWLRDYLYIPLGGNRHGVLMTYRNLFLTMFLGGLWHGAAWGFVLWGALHGTYLAIHKYISSRFGEREGKLQGVVGGVVKCIAIFVLVSLTWIPFREPDAAAAWDIFTSIIYWHGSFLDAANPGKVLEPGLALALSVLALLIIDLPMYLKKSHTAMLDWHWMVRGAGYAAMMTESCCSVEQMSTFIYFQF
jgi:alginate O-acetyltransferase complex protein AlgI